MSEIIIPGMGLGEDIGIRWSEDGSDGVADDWAIDRALELSGSESRTDPRVLAFARYIAAHEKPPVDPILIKAREIVAYAHINTTAKPSRILKGAWDHTPVIKSAMDALREGIKIGREQ